MNCVAFFHSKKKIDKSLLREYFWLFKKSLKFEDFKTRVNRQYAKILYA